MTKEEKNSIWFDSLLRIATSEALKNEMDSLPSKEELDKNYHPSDELNRRIKRIIIRNRIEQKVHAYAKSTRKIAAIIIILFTASSITLLSVETTRNAIFNLIIEHHDKYTEIRFDDSIADKANSDLYSPTYLPVGFKETSTVTYGNSVMQVYTNEEGIEIIFKQRPVETGTSLIDNENTEYKQIEIGGNVAYLFEALTTEDYNVLLWQSEGVVFELTSLLSSDELTQIGSNLK